MRILRHAQDVDWRELQLGIERWSRIGATRPRGWVMSKCLPSLVAQGVPREQGMTARDACRPLWSSAGRDFCGRMQSRLLWDPLTRIQDSDVPLRGRARHQPSVAELAQ